MNLAAQAVDDSYNYGDWLERVRNWLNWYIKRCPPLALAKTLFCFAAQLDSISFIIVFEIFSFLNVTQ